ncbi:MAG: hypothetical protein HC853_06630 [Anaerolineae bacterium]|nr:hypothetical protein [Anaerolineae bacterium]
MSVVVHIATEVIAPEVARRKANGWLLDQVGNLLIGQNPELVAGDAMVWRVTVVLTSPARGHVGTLGTVDVDAATGDVLADEAVILALQKQARYVSKLAQG